MIYFRRILWLISWSLQKDQGCITCVYALVICNHGPYGAMDSWGLAGLKYHDFTLEVSQQCYGYTRVLIPTKTAGEKAAYFIGFYWGIVSHFDGIFAGI